MYLPTVVTIYSAAHRALKLHIRIKSLHTHESILYRMIRKDQVDINLEFRRTTVQSRKPMYYRHFRH